MSLNCGPDVIPAQAGIQTELAFTRGGSLDSGLRGNDAKLASWVAALLRLAAFFRRDERGMMLPYVTVMLPVLVGFSLLALDGSRYMSLQTQMQAAADALAVAGARELNGKSGAQTRAISAMANSYASGGTANTLAGMGAKPTLAYTYTFYSAIGAASNAIGGGGYTVATTDQNSKYLAVTVTAQTVNTIFPVSYFVSGGANSFSAGAQAVAGYTGVTVCSVAPIFICNPYETSGMSDDQATQALLTAFATPATLRKQLKLGPLASNSTPSPGNFGWVVTADCTNSSTSCLRSDITSAIGACYNSFNIQLNTGNTNNLFQYFDTRFDIYSQNPAPATDATDPPAINVRKGYQPGISGNKFDWCSANPPPLANNNTYYTYPSVTTTGNITNTGTNKNVITNVANDSTVLVNEPVAGTGIPTTAGSNPNLVTAINGTSVTMAGNATQTLSGDSLTFQWMTSGLPEDTQYTAIGSGAALQGNGNWDCLDYWTINHTNPTTHALTAAAPTGCTASNPTVSRYQIYRDEISLGVVNDWSGNVHSGSTYWPTDGQADTQGAGQTTGGHGLTENGAPYCAIKKGITPVDTTTGGVDRRNIIVPIINCLAQAGNIAAGNNANAPVAAFGKFFLTQPYESVNNCGNGNTTGCYLYGEMTGTVGLGDHVTIYNIVQLYR